MLTKGLFVIFVLASGIAHASIGNTGIEAMEYFQSIQIDGEVSASASSASAASASAASADDSCHSCDNCSATVYGDIADNDVAEPFDMPTIRPNSSSNKRLSSSSTSSSESDSDSSISSHASDSSSSNSADRAKENDLTLIRHASRISSAAVNEEFSDNNVAEPFDMPTIKPNSSSNKRFRSGSISSSESDSDSLFSSDSSSSTSTSSSSSVSDSDSDSSFSPSNRILGIKKFKKSHGETWLKSSEKAKEHDIALIRHVREIDPSPKGKYRKPAGKAKYAFVKNTLKLKSKNLIKITVDTNGIKKGLTVRDGDKKLLKVRDTEYAIVKNGKHAISIVANKKGVEGTATIKVEKIELSEKIRGKYKFVSATVKARDAQKLCKRFGGKLAKVRRKDINKIIKAANKIIRAGNQEVWIERVSNDDQYSYLPHVLNLINGQVIADPDGVFASATEYHNYSMAAIDAFRDEKKKYEKAVAKVQAKIRKRMDKVLDCQDISKARAVLCRFD